MSRSTFLSYRFWLKETTRIAPFKRVRKRLKELSRITRRTPEELVEILIRSPLNQIVRDGDTDLMRIVLE